MITFDLINKLIAYIIGGVVVIIFGIAMYQVLRQWIRPVQPPKEQYRDRINYNRGDLEDGRYSKRN